MARQIMDGEIELKEGQLIIRSQLLANRNLGPKAMQEEIQGLERELSRARVEKEQHEVEELHTVTLQTLCPFKRFLDHPNAEAEFTSSNRTSVHASTTC